MTMICVFTLMIVIGTCWTTKSLEVYQGNKENENLGTIKE
jgi:hypothetical protein